MNHTRPGGDHLSRRRHPALLGNEQVSGNLPHRFVYGVDLCIPGVCRCDDAHQSQPIVLCRIGIHRRWIICVAFRCITESVHINWCSFIGSLRQSRARVRL
jgi:hypothetical protein